jgi:hypothetical protein
MFIHASHPLHKLDNYYIVASVSKGWKKMWDKKRYLKPSTWKALEQETSTKVKVSRNKTRSSRTWVYY